METLEKISKQAREQILSFEDFLNAQEGAIKGDSPVYPLRHSFTDEIYVREIFIPAGSYLTGKIHRHAHPNFLMFGTVDVFTESGGSERLIGPLAMISEPGTKRALHCLTDTWWITIHHNPTNTKDQKKLENIVIAPSYEEFDRFKRLQANKFVKFITGIKRKLLS